MSDLPPPAPARPRSWTRWLLLASLVLNGLLGGYVLGRVFMHHPPPMTGGPGLPGGLAGGLPGPLREAVRKDVSRADMHKRIEAIREARGEIKAAIQAEPFDRARLDKAFERLLDSQHALQRDLQTAASGAVARMSPAERNRLADWKPEGRERREGRERDGPPR